MTARSSSLVAAVGHGWSSSSDSRSSATRHARSQFVAEKPTPAFAMRRLLVSIYCMESFMKFSKIIPVVLLILAPAILSAQQPASLRQLALNSYQDKNYARSADYFGELIQGGKATADDYYNAACSAALAGRSVDAFRFLEQAIDAGYDAYDHLLTGDSDLA